MTRLSKMMTTTAITLGFAAIAASPALADATPECNDSAFLGTECGTDSVAGNGSTAVGNTASATGQFAVAVGVSSSAPVDNATAVGFLATASGVGSTANGVGAIAAGENSIATGINANAAGLNMIAIGANATARPQLTGAQDDNLAIGANSNSTGTHSTALGALADATGIGSTAIGWNADAIANNTTALGNTAQANAVGSTALGRQSNVNAAATNATAIGFLATVSAAATNSVAIGANSTATQANTVSVGTVGGERRIVNVSAGTATTDAVNFGQLSATNTALASETTNRTAADTALGARIDNIAFNLNDQVQSDRRDARAGTSAALAAAGMPQASDPGKTMIAGGVGYYRGRAALAIGASHRIANGSTIFKLGVTYDSSKTVGANGGVGFEF